MEIYNQFRSLFVCVYDFLVSNRLQLQSSIISFSFLLFLDSIQNSKSTYIYSVQFIKKQKLQSILMQNKLFWTFRRHIQLKNGFQLLVCGSIPELGSWNPTFALQMKYISNNNWELTVPVSASFEYKYMIQNQTWARQWDSGPNLIVDLNNQMLFIQDLKLMSFNIRYDNKGDGQFVWNNRKSLAFQILKYQMPSVLGIQEALKHQKQQLRENLNSYYQYYGMARDLKNDEECGIFYLRHRFRIHAQGLVWFNQTKTPGKIGYGANLPRNLTYLVLEDCILNSLIMIVNTHLDHQSTKSQQQSIRIIIETCEAVSQHHSIDGIFIMGDFNEHQNSNIFSPLYKTNFLSTRLKAEISDNLPTFHNFQGQKMMDKIKKGQNPGQSAIDHIFYRSNMFVPKIFQTYVVNKPYMSDHYAIVGVFKKI